MTRRVLSGPEGGQVGNKSHGQREGPESHAPR
jgi:hypothetical protein